MSTAKGRRGSILSGRLSGFRSDERGLTLIEMLAALLILSMIVAIVNAFVLMGAAMYKRITSETLLRNQANAVFASVINELRDAIYVQQGSNNKEIVVVKWGDTSADQYINEYTYSFISSDPNRSTEVLQIKSVDDDGNEYIRTHGVTDDMFSMKGSFNVLNQETVMVELEFFRVQENLTHSLEDVHIEIKQQIPLFRMK